MGYFYNYGPDYMFGFGWVFMLVFWALIVWGVVALIKGFNNSDHHNKQDEDKAFSLLRERYAKGDLSKKEYEEKKSDLMK